MQARGFLFPHSQGKSDHCFLKVKMLKKLVFVKKKRKKLHFFNKNFGHLNIFAYFCNP